MEDTRNQIGAVPQERSEESRALFPHAKEGETAEGAPVVWLTDPGPTSPLPKTQHRPRQVPSLPASVDIDRALEEMLETRKVPSTKRLKLVKILGYSLVGGLLGCCYCRLAFVEFDVNAGIVVTLLCLPGALYFLNLGKSYQVYLPDWDAVLTLLILLAIGFEVTIMILKAILAQIGLERLPDFAIFVMVAVACFGRALGWICLGILAAEARRKTKESTDGANTNER